MVKHFRELRVYQQAFASAQEIYKTSKSWPKEERYALTDQIRRASRCVCANIAEAWRKRRYERHFISKLSDADAEAAETQAWMDFALDAELITSAQYQSLDQNYEAIIGGLVKMMAKPDIWCGPGSLIKEEEAHYKA
jgi:four helix bundle protein